MSISDRAILLARACVGKTEASANKADWLTALMNAGGNPAKWLPGEPYCIAALCSIFTMSAEAEGKNLPIHLSKSTQKFFEDALAIGRTSPDCPAIGDIVIFQLGSTGLGHAGLVTNVIVKDGKNVGIDTIEFNTSADKHGDQRNGEGCYAKERLFSHFTKTDQRRLWIRGYVKTSKI